MPNQDQPEPSASQSATPEDTVLFIGGSHDGLRIAIPQDTRRVKVAVPDTCPVVETDYQQHVMVLDLKERTRVRLFVPITMSKDAALMLLISKYRP